MSCLDRPNEYSFGRSLLAYGFGVAPGVATVSGVANALGRITSVGTGAPFGRRQSLRVFQVCQYMVGWKPSRSWWARMRSFGKPSQSPKRSSFAATCRSVTDETRSSSDFAFNAPLIAVFTSLL